jgi:hypothetical protein
MSKSVEKKPWYYESTFEEYTAEESSRIGFYNNTHDYDLGVMEELFASR